MSAENDLSDGVSALTIADLSPFDTTDSDSSEPEILSHDTSSPDGGMQAVEPMIEAPRGGVFPRLRLPPEIRLVVYHHLVVDPVAVQLYKGDVVRRNQSERHQKKDLTIFVANRQVWTECSNVFYAENVFRFYIYGDEVDWPPTFPNLNRIRKCILWVRNPCDLLSDFNERRMIARRTHVAIECFASALAGDKQMEYLLIEIPDRCIGYDAKEILEPLRMVRRIKHVHIASHNIFVWSFLQHLERAMSLDADGSAGSDDSASFEPWSRASGFDAMLKQVAQSIRRVIERGKAGPQAKENRDLFAFFGILPRHNYVRKALSSLDSGSSVNRDLFA